MPQNDSDRKYNILITPQNSLDYITSHITSLSRPPQNLNPKKVDIMCELKTSPKVLRTYMHTYKQTANVHY